MPDDHVALRRLADAYAIAIDSRDREGLLRLFAPGAELALHNGDGAEPVVGLTGERIASVIDMLAEAYRWTFHLVGNHVCEVEGDRACGTTYCVAHHWLADGPVDEAQLIRYEDEYVRDEAGWRFASRRLRRLWSETRPAASAGITVDRVAAEAARRQGAP